MKLPIQIGIFIILSLLLGCEQSLDLSGKIEGLNTESEPDLESYQDQFNDEIIDSINLELALDDALKIAEVNFHKPDFTQEYTFHTEDDLYDIYIEIEMGTFFSADQKHLIIRRAAPWATLVNLYQIENKKSRQLIEQGFGFSTYVRDTIADVNGDGYKDFLTVWYPSSGCCLRYVYNVYLNQPKNGDFTESYEFINPTFSAKEKVIRGIAYGHPGQAELYKYKWNELQVDTIEYIYPNINGTGKFLQVKSNQFYPSEDDGIMLESVPKEYHEIEDYEYFIYF